jgi:hypothetical protein
MDRYDRENALKTAFNTAVAELLCIEKKGLRLTVHHSDTDAQGGAV